MPIYEYECSSCSKAMELLMKVGENEAPPCPNCQKPMKKLISATSFSLKGGGWYKDGYANPDPKAAKSEPKTKGAEPRAEPVEAVKTKAEKTSKTEIKPSGAGLKPSRAGLKGS